MTKLKPCPFCGSKPEGTTSGKDSYAGCRTEGCPVGGWDMDVEKWQARPITPKEEWISVEERLPKENEEVLCRWDWGYKNGHRKGMQACFLLDGHWEGAADYAGKVTHWMPLPSPPTKAVQI